MLSFCPFFSIQRPLLQNSFKAVFLSGCSCSKMVFLPANLRFLSSNWLRQKPTNQLIPFIYTWLNMVPLNGLSFRKEGTWRLRYNTREIKLLPFVFTTICLGVNSFWFVIPVFEGPCHSIILGNSELALWILHSPNFLCFLLGCLLDICWITSRY